LYYSLLYTINNATMITEAIKYSPNVGSNMLLYLSCLSFRSVQDRYETLIGDSA
jgi:hypothetical protein